MNRIGVNQFMFRIIKCVCVSKSHWFSKYSTFGMGLLDQKTNFVLLNNARKKNNIFFYLSIFSEIFFLSWMQTVWYGINVLLAHEYSHKIDDILVVVMKLRFVLKANHVCVCVCTCILWDLCETCCVLFFATVDLNFIAHCFCVVFRHLVFPSFSYRFSFLIEIHTVAYCTE